MGIWGFRQFEGDDAFDFTYEVEEQGVLVVRDALTFVAELPEDQFLESLECHRALAAAELVAAACGKPSSDIPEEMQIWVSKNVEQLIEFKNLALSATERVFRKSELLDVWSERDEIEEWKNSVSELLERLR